MHSQGPRIDSGGPEGFEDADASSPTDSTDAVPAIDKMAPTLSRRHKVDKDSGRRL